MARKPKWIALKPKYTHSYKGMQAQTTSNNRNHRNVPVN
jgi:hypothetical protein